MSISGQNSDCWQIGMLEDRNEEGGGQSVVLDQDGETDLIDMAHVEKKRKREDLEEALNAKVVDAAALGSKGNELEAAAAAFSSFLITLPRDRVERQKILNQFREALSDALQGSKRNEPEGTSSFPSGGMPIEELDEMVAPLFDPKRSYGKCEVCFERGHCDRVCPYMRHFPKGKPIGDGYDILCPACGRFLRSCGCNLNKGRVIYKRCVICHKPGHWPKECPDKDTHHPLFESLIY